jgi:hypothetical protein
VKVAPNQPLASAERCAVAHSRADATTRRGPTHQPGCRGGLPQQSATVMLPRRPSDYRDVTFCEARAMPRTHPAAKGHRGTRGTPADGSGADRAAGFVGSTGRTRSRFANRLLFDQRGRLVRVEVTGGVRPGLA